MGKLLTALSAKLEEVRKQSQEPAPDYRGDPKTVLEYVRRQNDLRFLETALGLKVVDAIRRLPKEKQDEFYEKCISPDNRDLFTKHFYEQRLDPNHPTGKTNSAWLTRDTAFGQDWHKTIETLEEMLSPEEIDRVTGELDQVKVPTDPSVPKEQKLTYPLADEIREIGESLDPDAPGTADDLAMLAEVNEELAVVSEELRDHIDKLDTNHDDVKGIQAVMDGYTFDMQNRFIKEKLEGGKYKDAFPKTATETAADGERYVISNTDARQLKPEDIETLKKNKLTVSEPLKSDILAVTNKMEALGEDKYRVPEFTIDPLQGGAPGETIFTGEQGYKFYAYWPLFGARSQLADAVKEKDLEKIRAAHEQYKSVKKEMDDMLGIVRKHPTGLCGGNINSTRSLPDGIANPMPLEHMEDFVGHSQVNGLFLLYAFSKNIKTTPDKLLEDPVGTISEAGKKYVENYGLNSRKTIGEKLYWGLSTAACRARFSRTWTHNIAMCGSRAFDGVACLADDAEERDRITGLGHIGIGAGSAQVNEHAKAWNKLATITEEQRNVLYQHAALLPEEEFDPLKYGEIFSKPDWKEKTDVGALIDRLKKENKLDYEKLAERADKVTADAKKADQTTETKYNADDYVFEAQKAYKLALRKAEPAERETEGFKKFAAGTETMLTKTKAFQDVQDEMERLMRTGRTEKKGFFLSSKNTDEYTKMVRSQNTFRFKLMQMQGKPLPEELSEEDREYLRTVSVKTAYEGARAATYDYCVKKTDKGRSSSFVHEVGRTRYDASLNSLRYMDALADTLELRSPADKLIDNAKMDVLRKRNNVSWTPEMTEKAAAKIMYAMTLEHQGISPEEQKARLEPKRLEMGIAYIRGQEAFKKMMKNEGAEKLADFVAEGHGKVTDAYVRGMNGAAKERHQAPGKDPKQMSYEEKTEVWKNQTLQM